VPHPGRPIVLTADRTLTARYSLLFDGMVAASTTTSTPRFLADFLTPAASPLSRGLPAAAPLGLRRLEAALLRSGVPPEEVAVADEEGLEAAIGSETRVVGISSGEPAGRGMNSSTMEAISGGCILPRDRFQRLLHRVRALVKERAPRARLVLGGPGAWQLPPAEARALGIHHVVVGYAEADAPDLFARLRREATDLPVVLRVSGPPADQIPPLRGPATMGALELSRGCGLGCSFCTLSREPMIHLPPSTILSDARTNLEGGQTSLSLLSEDFFRYGGPPGRARPAALIELVRSLRSLPGLKLLQIDHANLSTVAQFTDGELRALHDLLTGGPRHRYLWVNVGLETASGPLLRRNGGGAKMGGAPPDDWDRFAALQVGRLLRAGFFPLVSLVLGLPGESPEDVARTQEWVERFREARLAVFPMLYAPVNGEPAPRPTPHHWRLIRSCYRLNFRWIPRLYEDNQHGAGVPAARRLLMSVLGCAQIVQWDLLLRWKQWRAGR